MRRGPDLRVWFGNGESYGEWISSLAYWHVRNRDHGGRIGGIEWSGSGGVRRLRCPRTWTFLRPTVDRGGRRELCPCRRPEDARAAGRRLWPQSAPRPDRGSRRGPVRGCGRRWGHQARLRHGNGARLCQQLGHHRQDHASRRGDADRQGTAFGRDSSGRDAQWRRGRCPGRERQALRRHPEPEHRSDHRAADLRPGGCPPR